MQPYIIFMIILIVGGALLGFILPSLFSAKSDVQVMLGVVVAAISALGVVFLIRRLYKSPKVKILLMEHDKNEK